jgi:hypothetical protein
LQRVAVSKLAASLNEQELCMTDQSDLTHLPFNLPLLGHMAVGTELTIAGQWKTSPHKHKVTLKSGADGIVDAAYSDPSGARYDLKFNTRSREMTMNAPMRPSHSPEALVYAGMLLGYVEQLVGFLSPPKASLMH